MRRRHAFGRRVDRRVSQNAASERCRPTLVDATLKAAIPFAAGQAATSLVSATVAALTEGALHAMFVNKVKQLTAALAVLTLLGTTGGFAHWALADAQRTRGAASPERARSEGAAAGRERAPADDKQLSGVVVAADKAGKSITIESPARERGGEPVKTTVPINDKTAITYHGVGVNGAKPTEGYQAHVQLTDAKDFAASIRFASRDGGRRSPDVGGKVIAVAKDGKSITMSRAWRAAPARNR